MIKFDKSKFEIRVIQFIAVSSAMGGAFRQVVDGHETRHEIPFAVARKLTKRYGQRLIEAIPMFAVIYDGEYICLDSYLVFDKSTEELADTPFISDLRNSIEELSDDSWCFDGRFVFKMHNIAPHQQPFLTQDGMIRSWPATCIDLQGIRGDAATEDEDEVTDVVDDRDCVAVYSKTGQVFVSPPVWSSLENVRRYAKEQGKVYYQMDELDKNYRLTLDFILSTAKVIGYNFGYAHIVPLRIPNLMVSLNTVNLAKIDPQSRKRIDAGFSVTQAILYLVGYIEKTQDLNIYKQIKQLLKHTVGRWSVSVQDQYDNMELVDLFQDIELIDHNQLLDAVKTDEVLEHPIA